MSLVSTSAGQLMQYNGAETSFTLRFEPSASFVDSGGATILGGRDTSEDYLSVACTVAGGVISHAGFSIHSNVINTVSNPKASAYKVTLWKGSNGKFFKKVYGRLLVPPTPTPTTFGALQAYSNVSAILAAASYYNKTEIDALIAGLTSSALKATEVIYGVGRLNTPATLASDPIFIGPNDPLLTGGGASTTRKYRKAFLSLAAAKTAAAAGELVFDQTETVAADTTLEKAFATSLEGTGIFDITNASATLTVESLVERAVKLWKGPGKAVVKNAGRLRMENWIGPFGNTTTLNGGINNSVTSLTFTDGTVFGNESFYISIDGEVMLVSDVTGNVGTVTRAQDGTSAASHSNGATIYCHITAKMWDGMKTSATIVGGGCDLIAPRGTWTTKAVGTWPQTTKLLGAGGHPDMSNGTVFRFFEAAASFIAVGGNRHPQFERFGVDIVAADSKGFDIAGTTGETCNNMTFRHVTVRGGTKGWDLRDTAGAFAFSVIEASFEHCTALNSTVACFHHNRIPNSSWEITHFRAFPAANQTAIAFDLDYPGQWAVRNSTIDGVNINQRCKHSAVTTIESRSTTAAEDIDNSETTITVANGAAFGAAPFVVFNESEQMNVTAIATNDWTVTRGYNSTTAAVHANGTTFRLATKGLITATGHGCTVNRLEPVTMRTRQTEKQEIAVTSVAAGNARCVVTAAGLSGSPITVTFAVANSDTATQVATKAETALNANATIAAFFTVSRSTNTLYLTRNADTNYNDSTMNFTIEDVTSTGITDDLFSVNAPELNLPGNYTDKERVFFKAIDANNGYSYTNPHVAFNADEHLHRKLYTAAGSNLVLRTTVPVYSGIWSVDNVSTVSTPYASFRIQNTIYGGTIDNVQDEGLPNSLIIENTYEKTRGISITGKTSFQGITTLNTQCQLDVEGTFMPRSWKDYASNIDTSNCIVRFKGVACPFDGSVGVYTDMGQTEVDIPDVANFSGNTQMPIDENHQLGRTEYNSPSLRYLNWPWVDFSDPVDILSRARNALSLPIARRGLFEDGASAKDPTRYYDWHHLDSSDAIVATYPHLDQHYMLLGDLSKTDAQKGFVSFGHLKSRGIEANLLHTEITSSGGVTPLNANLGNYFYFGSLSENTTINVTGGIQGQEIYILIPATATNRIVTFGSGLLADGVKVLNTKRVTGKWQVAFRNSDTAFRKCGPYVFSSDGADSPETIPNRSRGKNADFTILLDTDYLTNSGSRLLCTLPATAHVGARMSLYGMNTGGWRLVQNAGQKVILSEGGVGLPFETTAGTGGYIESIDGYDNLEIENIVEDTTFKIKGRSPALRVN